MRKKITVYINVKVPAEANIYSFIENLKSFLDVADALGEVECDFSTSTFDPVDHFSTTE